MIRGFLTRRAEWPARIPDPDAPPPLSLLWREVGALLRAIGGRIRPMPPEPNPDSDHPPVMVLPGFLSGDWATKALRAYFAARVFAAMPGASVSTAARQPTSLSGSIPACSGSSTAPAMPPRSSGGASAASMRANMPSIIPTRSHAS